MTTTDDLAKTIAPVRPALDALRFFTATTRGFRKREQEKLAAFLKETVDLSAFSTDEVVDWLRTKAGWIDTHDYRNGDVSHYLALLKAIPAPMLARTRDHAAIIAGGSGRVSLSEELRDRIDREFCADPIVIPPPPDDDDSRLAVRIGPHGAERL